MRFRTTGLLVLSALTIAASAAAQTTPTPSAATRTVVAAAKLPTVTDLPLYFRAAVATLTPGQTNGAAAVNGILYQISGSTEFSVGGEAKTLNAGEGSLSPGFASAEKNLVFGGGAVATQTIPLDDLALRASDKQGEVTVLASAAFETDLPKFIETSARTTSANAPLSFDNLPSRFDKRNLIYEAVATLRGYRERAKTPADLTSRDQYTLTVAMPESTTMLRMVGSPKLDDFGKPWTVKPGIIKQEGYEYTGTYTWEPEPPQTIGPEGIDIKLTVKAETKGNQTLSTGIGIKGGFDFKKASNDTTDSPTQIAAFSEKGQEVTKNLSLRVQPQKQYGPDQEVELQIGAFWGPSVTYKYKVEVAGDLSGASDGAGP